MLLLLFQDNKRQCCVKFVGVLCAAEEEQPSDIPACVSSFNNASLLVVWCEICSR